MRRRPRVIAALDTRWAWGRGFLHGIATFAERHARWDWDFNVVGPLTANDVLRINSADGLIARINTPASMAAARKIRVPVVSVEVGSPRGMPNVHADPAAIGRLAAEHFVERGFRRFAYCAFHNSPIAIARGQGFTEALRASGHECEWFTLKSRGTRQDWRPDHRQLIAWVKRLAKPAGVFCVGDARAREVANACRDAGIAIPAQIALLGVDNDELLCRLCSPQLSSIDAGAHGVGFEAARLLQKAMAGNVIIRPVAVPPVRVVVRESSDIISVEDSHIVAAARYIREHTHEGVNVKQLMQHLPICRRTLELGFRKQLGRTLHDEIVLARFHQAARLLVESRLPLARVAERCGMGHPSRLNSLIRKMTGFTPLQYRNKYQPISMANPSVS